MHTLNCSLFINDSHTSLERTTPLRDVTNVTHTALSKCHNIEIQSYKWKGFDGRINLFNRFTNIVPKETNNVPLYPINFQGTTTTQIHHVHSIPASLVDSTTTTYFPPYIHSYDEGNANPDDEQSLANTSDSDESLQIEPIIDSHIKCTLLITHITKFWLCCHLMLITCFYAY